MVYLDDCWSGFGFLSALSLKYQGMWMAVDIGQSDDAMPSVAFVSDATAVRVCVGALFVMVGGGRQVL